jgi:hypothetical protein
MPGKVVATSEDYLWVQLVLAREEEVGEKWGLGEVARGVVKAGRSAWDRSGQRPEGYFLVLILVGEYERVQIPTVSVADLGCSFLVESFAWRGDSFRYCPCMVRPPPYLHLLNNLRRRST